MFLLQSSKLRKKKIEGTIQTVKFNTKLAINEKCAITV